MRNAVEIKFSRENEECIIPSRTHGNAGFDVYIDAKWFRLTKFGALVMYPNDIKILPTGIRCILPPTHYFNLAERGSTGIKGLSYRAGIVDSNYRGVINAVINNTSNNIIVLVQREGHLSEEDLLEIGHKAEIDGIMFKDVITYPITKGIAQLVLHEVPETNIMEVGPDEILADVTDRGEGKFGSSGK